MGTGTAVSTDGVTETKPNTSETPMANIIMPIATIEIAGTVTKDGATNGGGKTAITAVKAQLHISSQARSCFRACFLPVTSLIRIKMNFLRQISADVSNLYLDCSHADRNFLACGGLAI